MNIYIVGHISPDLDSVAASIEYLEFLNKTNRYPKDTLKVALAGKPNKETQFVFEKFGVEFPELLDNIQITEEDRFILTDHNEQSQRHPKIQNDQVIEIIDHHKLNINFNSLVRLDTKPYGSTSTIIYELFSIHSIKPSKEVQGLIISSILSDTQGLKSSLTTGYDSEVCHKISEELQIDIDKLTFDIFKAKSDIGGLTPEQIVAKDFKIFDFGGKSVFIGQVETVEPEKVLEQKDAILKAIDEVKVEQGVSQLYLIITDILKVSSIALYTTEAEKEVLERAFTTHGHDNIAEIGPRMSRKKDIAPEIEKIILNK